MAWTATTDDLADAIRECAALPDAGTLTDAEIFRVADREIQTRFVPFMREVREGYGLTYTSQALTVGTADYRIPSDAQGGTIQSLVYVDSSGNERNLTRLTIQDDQEWSTNGSVRGYALYGSKIRLLPTPDTADTLRIWYYRRPSKLVAVSTCAEILSTSNADAGIDYTGYSAIQGDSGDPFDIAQATPPFDALLDNVVPTINGTTTAINIAFAGGVAIQIDGGSGWSPAVGDSVVQGSTVAVVTFVSTSTIFTVDTAGLSVGAASAYETSLTFTGYDLEDLGVLAGDYVCRRMETCVVPLPAELYYALVSAVAAQLMNQDGDQAGFMREMAQCERLMRDARSILSPRADGSPRFIFPRNSPTRSRFRRQPGWDVSR